MSGKTCTLTDPEREMVKRNSLIGGSDDDYDDYEDFDDGDAKSSGHPGNPTTARRRSGGIVRGKWKASMREMRMICDFKVRSKLSGERDLCFFSFLTWWQSWLIFS